MLTFPRVWRLAPKQDHLVCFLGGSLMLGATLTGATTYPVSIPPHASQLTREGRRDWINGVELIKTCMKTHDTQTCEQLFINLRFVADAWSL